ncbi:hypothetical protein BWI17_10135 [Betaproteobacteria bacterium GR16-43]|nr:hypothetical protein BWI17_10135 [Betaproteobacteria bacterium GR16-43]
MTDWVKPTKAQEAAARAMVEAIVPALRTEKGTHAETAIAAAARMGGTFLFRSFHLPTAGIEPGAPVFSDLANDQGPALMQTFAFGAVGEGLDPTTMNRDMQVPDQNRPLLTVNQTQSKLEPALRAIAAKHRLTDVQAAHACALAAAKLVKMTVQVLPPHMGLTVAAYGFVEGSKTMPIALPAAAPGKKPWYRFW